MTASSQNEFEGRVSGDIAVCRKRRILENPDDVTIGKSWT